MKLSDYIIESLIEYGVKHVFEVCGGALAHLLDSMHDRDDITAVSMHHEMAAAIAAEGYARVTGNLGVAMATSGPGATNLITGIGSCFFDSIPCLFITGQVNTYEYKFDLPIRQIGFQETDIVNIVRPIVKNAVLITNEEKIRYLLQKLIHETKHGRPGPVLMDVPLNIQRSQIDIDSIDDYNPPDSIYNLNDDDLEKIASLIEGSLRPVVLVGGGLRLSDAEDELLKFVQNTHIPVVSSLMGLDSFPHDHESYVGMIGTYGNRYANLTISNADLVIALGTRLDTRQTGTKPKTFARGAKLIHVDIDPIELNNKIKADYSIQADAKHFLFKINELIHQKKPEDIENWKKTIKSFKDKYKSCQNTETSLKGAINPNLFMEKLSAYLPSDAIICVDVGQNQMWSAQSLILKKDQRLLTQGGMASIGSALPLAIGASFAAPDRMVVVITGDGGFQLNIQELQTVYHHQLPIKIILLNNNCYGMIKQFQEQYLNSRCQSSVDGYSCPNFQDVVAAYKLPVVNVSETSQLKDAFENLFKELKPMFMEVDINSDFKALPKLSVNRPVEDQEPVLPLDELKSNMLIDIIGRNDDEN